MVHILKDSAAKKCFAVFLAALMFMCAGFSGYTSDTDAEQKGDEKSHSLTISAKEVLEAFERGALTAEETAEYKVVIPPTPAAGDEQETEKPTESSQQESESAPESQPEAAPEVASEPEKSYASTSAQPAGEDTSSEEAQGENESSEVSDNSSSESSSESSSQADEPKQEDGQVYSYQLEKSLVEVLNQIKLPYGSNLMKAQLAQSLVGVRLVHFFGSTDTGCAHCQAIVTINPATKQVSVTAINADESKPHTFILNILDENGMPLRVQDAEKNGLTADKRVLDGTVAEANLPADALIEVLEVTYTGTDSETNNDTTSSQKETSSEPSEESSSQEAEETSSQQAEEPSIIYEPVQMHSFVAQQDMTTVEEEQTSFEDATSSEDTSSEDTSSQETPSDETSSKEASSDSNDTSSDDQDTSSDTGDVSPSEPKTSDKPEVQTTILLLSPTSEKLELSMFAGVPIKVETGFSAAAATLSSTFGLSKIHLDKSAELLSEDDRTYQISLAVWGPAQQAAPADIVLVLDASGSMPWLMTVSSEPTTVSKLPNPNQPEWDHPAPDPTNFDYYKYFVFVENEYRPIEYLKANEKPQGYYGEIKGTGWYRIESRSTGEKSIASGKLEGNTVVYVKGENDKTKLDMLKEYATDFVTNVANSSPNSRIAVVSFNNTGTTLCGLTTLNSNGVSTVKSAIQNIRLTGNTKHDEGLKRAREIIDGAGQSDRSKYVILFTDGEPVGSTKQDAINVAEPLKKKCTLFTIGMYGGGISSNKIRELEDFLKALATSPSHYYNANNSGLGNVFATIFGNISGALSGAVITDVVNERFTLTQASRQALIASGATITTDDQGRDVITWTNQTIPGSGSADSGWKASFVVQARENYVGGNQVPTNSAGSQITHPSYPDASRPFSVPEVDVPLRYDLVGRDAYLYAGDALAADLSKLDAGSDIDWQTYGDTQIVYSLREVGQQTMPQRPDKDTDFELVATVQPVNTGKYRSTEFVSDNKQLHILTPLIELSDTKIFAGEKTNLNDRVKTPVWQYKTGPNDWSSNIPAQWVYAGAGSGTPPTLSYEFSLRGKGDAVSDPANVILDEKTDFNVLAKRLDVPETYQFSTYACYLNNNYNQNNDGWFTIDVDNGSIAVTKVITENWAPHGDPIFAYKLEKLGDDGSFHEIASNYVRFTGGSSGAGKWVEGGNTDGTGEKTIVFEKLGAGTYRLTELDSIRYNTKSVTASSNGTVSGKSVVFTIASTSPTGSARYINDKWQSKWYSHTDVVRNSFAVKR